MLIPPFAKTTQYRMRERGTYPRGFPSGAVVHFTAGRDGAEKTIKDGIANGYTYWCIERDGDLYCAHNADKWGYHAGESAWKNPKFLKRLVGSVSDDLIGIEMNAAGRVTPLKNGNFLTWFKAEIPKQDVRYTAGIENQLKGYYHKYTEAQERTLINTLLWLKIQCPDIFSFDLCLGHDEVAGPLGIGYWRKNDPGAALSMTMPQLRAHLKATYSAGK